MGAKPFHPGLFPQGSSVRAWGEVAPVLAGTTEKARAERRLAFRGKIAHFDFARFDLDAPVVDLITNGHQQTLADFKRRAGGRTLREATVAFSSDGGSVALIGSPDDVAARMAEAMEAAGGDGFLFSMPDVSRRAIAEIEDGLVPALQRRGPIRQE